MYGFLEDQRGVSAILGFVMVIALVAMAMGVYLMTQVPQEWREAEWETMNEVKSSFMELRETIQTLGAGDVVAVKVRMGTLSTTAMLSDTTSAALKVVSAKNISDVSENRYYSEDFSRTRAYGTYVEEGNPTQNYTSSAYDNDHLYISSYDSQRMRTYLKFDLSDSYLYDRTDREFYDDVNIHEVQLLLYVESIDPVTEPSEVLEAGTPIKVEPWLMENDNWDENTNWATRPDDESTDTQLENADVNDINEWLAFDVTNIVKNKFEKYRGGGKWYQTEWYDQVPGEVGKFSSGYSKFSDQGGVTTGDELTGDVLPGNLLQSSIFDADDSSAYWNHVTYDYDGAAPTVNLYFDNDTDFTDAVVVSGVSPGDHPNIFARYARYEVDPNGGTFDNMTLEYTRLLSFVLREPKTTNLRNRAGFTSRDNYGGGYDFSPRLRIVYSREGRTGKVSEGLVDFGYIKYEANNKYFPTIDSGQYYIYEGGMVTIQRKPGWYETMLAEPPDFITLAPAGGNNVRVTVKRYQIEEGSVGGESIGGTGYTSIRAQREEIENIVDMPSSPNRSAVTITIRTDHKSAWRDYLERLAAKLNYKMGGDWDQYGVHVNYDYDSVGLTIKGKVLDPSVQDIYYAEQVIWLDTTLGSFAGGRT